MSIEYPKLQDENMKLRMVNDSLLNALKYLINCDGLRNFKRADAIWKAKEAIKAAEQI